MTTKNYEYKSARTVLDDYIDLKHQVAMHDCCLIRQLLDNICVLQPKDSSVTLDGIKTLLNHFEDTSKMMQAFFDKHIAQ